MPCDDCPAQAPCCEGCDAVPRGQEGGGPEAVQGGAGLLCGLRSRPHRLA